MLFMLIKFSRKKKKMVLITSSTILLSIPRFRTILIKKLIKILPSSSSDVTIADLSIKEI